MTEYSPADCGTDTATSKWAVRRPAGWRRFVFPSVFLVYLSQTAWGITKYSSGFLAILGFVILAAFCVAYIVGLPYSWDHDRRGWMTLFVATIVLTVAMVPLAHQDAFVMFVFVSVLAIGGLRRHFPVVAALAIATAVVPKLITSWHQDYQWGTAASIVLVSFAMVAFFGVIRSNIELAVARAEVARLAAENERTRIARDLHDLLGHSLTTITVKAGLARKLSEHGEPGRAATEIAEVETLARRTLSDVRAAVSGHRDVTLAGELATAREVLRASEIDAELPGSVDVVDPTLSELFGWVLRESVTNVIRHSRARRCTVTFGRNWIEIQDNGRGGFASSGTGLLGLRERVEASGGTLSVGNAGPTGWRVRAEVPVGSPESAKLAVREPADSSRMQA